MKTKINILALVLLAFIAAMGSVFADPITVEDVKVQEVNGDYMVLVTLENDNTSTGVFSELDFTIEELGTTHTEDVTVKSNGTTVMTFNLEDVVSNFDLLKKGETYTLEVETEANSDSTNFLFGTERDTEGLDLLIEEIEINDVEVTDIDTLQVLNGEEVEVQVRFTALESFDDARLRITIDGYEHGVIDDSTPIFSVEEGKTYVKTLSVNLPADMDTQEDYVLRIFGANDLSGITYKEIDLYIDTQRHRVDILDLVMTPSSGVEPGQNVIANVRLKNRGQQEQDSVKVTVTIPELGATASSYVSNLGDNEVVTSDDMLLFIPESAQAGQYQARVTLAYNDGYTETASLFAFNVLAPRTVPERNLLVSFRDNLNLEAGEETSFEVVIANPNTDSKPISLSSLDNTWADVEISPTLSMVQGGSSATYTVTVTPKDAIEGERVLTLFVKEGSETVSEVSINTYVEPADGINWVNVVLAILLIVFIIVLLALIVTIARRRNDSYREEEVSSTEEYY